MDGGLAPLDSHEDASTGNGSSKNQLASLSPRNLRNRLDTKKCGLEKATPLNSVDFGYFD